MPTPLSLALLQKAQAEAEGFANGPQPALNLANIYTQDSIGNPQTPGTSPTPYYPSSETPNLQLSTDDMPSTIANNFVILDTFAGLGSVSSFNGRVGAVAPLVGDYAAFYDTLGSAIPRSLMTVAGDIIYENATPTAARLPIGTAGQVLTVVGGAPSWVTPSAGSAASLRLSPVVLLSGGADAIDPHTPAAYMVTTAGVNAMTLAAPTVTTDDGVVIKVTLSTNAAHTITCTGGTLRPGTAAVTTINFASFRGSSVELMAWQGNWYVMAQNLVASYT